MDTVQQQQEKKNIGEQSFLSYFYRITQTHFPIVLSSCKLVNYKDIYIPKYIVLPPENLLESWNMTFLKGTGCILTA